MQPKNHRLFTVNNPPTVGVRVRPRGELLCACSKSDDLGTVIEVYLNPSESTPLDEEVWGLLDSYDNEYPKWIARVEWDDNPDAATLVGPSEISAR